MMTNQKYAGTILTTWELRTYDVWGNKYDGYEVNNSFSAGTVELRIPVTRYNVGTPHEFRGASPTDRQIKRAFNVTCRIETDGDDMHVLVNRERDDYPIGEMHCTSHVSLSAVRKYNRCSVCGIQPSDTDNVIEYRGNHYHAKDCYAQATRR